MMLVSSLAIMAQVTTSSLNGKVVADDGPVIGATVTAVHEPSGTRYNAITNNDGRYTIQGMRVGGPYTVTIDYIGYKQDCRKNINLQLGEPQVINVKMQENAQELGEVVVVSKGGRGGNGASSNFSHQAIENTPTIDRNIYDVAKLSPLVNNNKSGGITIAGANNRYNSFQIDGMVSNDVFGLTSSGTNGGQSGANPISMDAIDQIQISVSPFDVRQGGFTGGAINAITKSGTNKLTGTAYTYYTDENLYGRYNQRYKKTQKLTDEKTNTYGFTLGGPIVKDKLFFFTSVEYKKNSYPSSYYAGCSDDYFMTTEMAQKLADAYYKITGIRESYGPRNIDKDALSLIGKLDWNINNNNHLTFRYQGNISSADSYSSGQYTYYFNNSGFQYKNTTHSFVAELTSHIGQKYYNELRAGVTFVRDHRETPYSGPTLYFSGNGYSVNLGTEYSSGVNKLDQDIWTIEDNFSIYSGNHTFTLGTHNEIYNMGNGFYQAAYGEYAYGYTQLEEFINNPNIIPSSGFILNYSDQSLTGSSHWVTPFKAGMFGLYAQDKWDVSTRFQLTYGLRIDFPLYFNKPSYNDAFNQTEYWSKSHNAIVGRRPASMVMTSPRVGFRWYPTESRSTLIRGGAGIFSGRAPFVWIENAWANTGVEIKGMNIRNTDAQCPDFGTYGNKTADEMIADLGAKGGVKPNYVTIDHRFSFPQTFRANLALHQDLPGGVKMTLEALYSRALNAVWFENLALQANGKVYAVPGVESSATTYYSSNQYDSYIDASGNKQSVSGNSIINLSNINRGHSYSFSAKFEKSFDFGLDLMASYTFGHSYSVNDGTSSVANSNWKNYYCVDPNKKELSYSMFDVPHRVMVQANYNSKRYGNGRWQTHVGLTYNGNSGSRYSIVLGDNVSASFNGDYAKGNTLLYIPTTDELAKMNFAKEEDRQAYGQWIENDAYAKNHRGQYAKRNSNMAPWENRVDFHFTQDFFYLKERGSKVSLVFDILNVANLLNHDWGTTYSSTWSTTILSVTKVAYDKTTQIATPTYSFTGAKPTISDVSSRWHMQLGLRVTF